MRRRSSTQLIVIIGFLILDLIIIISLIAFSTTEVIAQAGSLTLKSVDGKEVSLADHRRKVVVLAFNANWTPLANKSLPALQRVADLYNGRGVVFYWVSINSAQVGDKHFATDADLKAFAQENDLRLTELRDPESKAFHAFGLDVIPSIVIIDRAGQVYQKHAGFDPPLTKAINL